MCLFSDAGVGDSAGVRDLWRGRDMGIFQQSYAAEVAKHGVVLTTVK